MDKETKNRVTIFLERNEIWFKTVLWLAVTVAALFISYASYSIARDQRNADVTAQEIEEKARMPFFSVENTYDNEREQFVFKIVNTGGKVRESDVFLFPYLWCVYSKDEHLTSIMYVSLDNFYDFVSVPAGEDILFLFRDRVVETQVISDEFSSETTRELANDYFKRRGAELVSADADESIYLDIIYRAEIFYYDDKNEFLMDTIWLKPSYNVIDPQVKGTILETANLLDFDMSIAEAKDKGYVFNVATEDRPIEDIWNDCSECIKTVICDTNAVG